MAFNKKVEIVLLKIVNVFKFLNFHNGFEIFAK